MNDRLVMWVNQFYRGTAINWNQFLMSVTKEPEDMEFVGLVCAGYLHVLITKPVAIDVNHSLYPRYLKLLENHGWASGDPRVGTIAGWLAVVKELMILGPSVASLYPDLDRYLKFVMLNSVPYSNMKGIYAQVNFYHNRTNHEKR